MASTYLSKTFSGSGTSDKIWTMSVWVKRASSSTEGVIFAAGTSEREFIRFESTGELTYRRAAGTTFELKTNRKFRDTNSWYHIVIAVDTSQSTDSNKYKLYINGVQETSLATATYMNNNYLTKIGGGQLHTIGKDSEQSTYFDGCMSHFHFCDGTQLAPTVFGETDSTTGEWKIITDPSFTLGTNGFTVLKDGNTITDQSSNSNDFALGGGVLTKTEDNPSNVFATWNSLNPVDAITYSYGNCVITGSNSTNYTKSAVTTLGASSGKYYWEMKHTTANANNNTCIGVANLDNYESNQNITSGTTGYVTLRFDGERQINGATTSSYFTTPNAGDILMCAMDMDNGKVFFGNNGTWFGSGNPVTGANPTADILTSGTWGGTIRYLAAKFECNFGNGYIADNTVSSAGTNASNIGIFEYDVPTGYTALCTKGINSF